MCRLFGFRSVISSQVHSSLVSADNALMVQSERHPDGWGVAYFMAGAPHLIKSSNSAVEDKLFQRVSGIVSSETVLAHLRNSTIGGHSIVNTHPFQFGNWVFAHNGNIKDFPKYREKLRGLIDQSLARYILGETDSELIFFALLSEMKKRFALHEKDVNCNDLATATHKTIEKITAVTGAFCRDDNGENTETFLSFLLTNGSSMVSHQGGKHLYYSTHKKRCSERDTCPYFAPQCEKPSPDGKVSHLIFASEPLGGENVWQPMGIGEIITISPDMIVQIHPSTAP